MTAKCKHQPEMNMYVSNSERSNRQVAISPLQYKLQKISEESKEPERMINDNGGLTPLQRRLQRSGSSRDNGFTTPSTPSSKKDLDPEKVLELLELLQTSSDAIQSCVVSKHDRQPPQRTYSEELFSPSRRRQRTGVRTPLRLMPKVKPASLGDLYDGTANRASKKKGRKKELRGKEDDFNFESSPSASITGLTEDRPERLPEDPSDGDIDETIVQSVGQNFFRSSSTGDLFHRNQTTPRKEHIRKARKERQKSWEFDFAFESSPKSRTKKELEERWHPLDGDIDENKAFDDRHQNRKPKSAGDLFHRHQTNSKEFGNDERESKATFNGTAKEPQGRWNSSDSASIDASTNSFMQESSSVFGDFHDVDKSHRWRCRSKSQEKKEDLEQQKRRSLLARSGSSGSLRLERSGSSGSLVVHNSSTMSESNQKEDEKPKRRRRRCSSGGKVRNHRTQEEYTGFFLTSNNEEENLKHGYGITKFPDGRVFEGVYEKGSMVEGKMTYPAVRSATAAAAVVKGDCSQCLDGPGETYVGKFDEDGLRCGKGIYTASTYTFLGQFDRDVKHGSGILIYHDGTDDVADDTSQSRRFIGHWVNGLKHGYGKEIHADGTVEQEGLWDAGYFTGAVASPRKFTDAVAPPKSPKSMRKRSKSKKAKKRINRFSD